MIVEIQFLDVFSTRKLSLAGDMAVVSLLGASEEEHRPTFEGLLPARLLRLQFEDTVYIMGPASMRAAPCALNGLCRADPRIHRRSAPPG